MAGLYIHIPFCEEKCFYCDFYSGNQLYLIEEYVNAIKKELILRRSYIADNELNTIYFGGGTPSLLNREQLWRIVSFIKDNFNVTSLSEVTIECNPENINEQYVKDLLSCGFNRISLGIQFLDNTVLHKFNRKHNTELIYNALSIIQSMNFPNLSVDIIYAVPGISNESLVSSLTELVKFDIKHFSAYSLTIAENSQLYWKIRKGDVVEQNEEVFIAQYHLVQTFLEDNGYFQYEVSNYAKSGYFSRHNLSYWDQEIYLGVGVSAHSYNLISRQWNKTSVKRYIKLLEDDKIDFEIEVLTDIQRYNEYIILKLRTFMGMSFNYVEDNFDNEIFLHFKSCISRLRVEGYFKIVDDRITPRKEDLLKADYLAKILMF